MAYRIIRLVISEKFGDTVNTVYPTLWDEKNIVLVDCGFIGLFLHSKRNWRNMD